MEPIQQHTGKVYPLNRANVDTDQIIPKQFLKRIERQGFGQFLFYNWRYYEDGTAKEDFSLNEEKYQDATILVAGENFGCGSSREHAPWALEDFGFRVIIAPSFADIFYNNCVKNGILPVTLSEEQTQELMNRAEAEDYPLTVNLEDQTVSDEYDFHAQFDIDNYSKEMLINGWDEIAVTLTKQDKIDEYEEQMR
ncbi:3-isopropylmalate dehydratase small subunit [Pontibacillus yanchengensis]|uniref:3-isopropylmalate dehydratase small subunit n=2 Tax=Pontibacillus yanchengensis TaxID=462910 RepID=A0ACC7VEA1_9BACI|nr:3-isopropylmalate dehydratase small subunit [Pontibacillus yanchengensis]MYL35114.1 3-isopropylmalate dehydratase small subunit [Pontibacillus yanchengensis]MYL52519.1 3-isopropylmalate dehydratase small subunit [Pontibacillus yanchengensis]